MPAQPCEKCGKSFARPVRLKAHYLAVHKIVYEPPSNKQMKTGMICAVCKASFVHNADFDDHLVKEHSITVDTKCLSFNNKSDFENWKRSVENESNSKFVIRWVHKNSENEITHYKCNRAGPVRLRVADKDRKRNIKIQGSCKTGYHCPARIVITATANSCIEVEYCSTHFGHKTRLAHVTLPSPEKRKIAAKLSSKIPFNHVLDSIQGDLKGELKRSHLTDRQDLINIITEYGIDSEIVRDSEDALSVEKWVELESASVILYKAKGVDQPEFPQLATDDFLLGIMTEGQSELLKKYGSDCVCIDSTHGTNAYGYEITTLLVLDDVRQGFPCAFFISGRNDHVGVEIFLEKVRDHVGILKPHVFMSDMAAVLYNSWSAVMGKCRHRLFCTWHVLTAWRKNLNLVKCKEERVNAYNKLFTLLHERDVVAFEKVLPGIINDLCTAENTADYGKYFKVNYEKSKENWAHCYRLEAGINTNMHVERHHRDLKHVYLEGKCVKRLDRTIDALMRLVHRKFFDRLRIMEKGKVTYKLRELRRRHKTSLEMSLDNVHKNSDDSFTVFSAKSPDTYRVTQKALPCLRCSLNCSMCKACFHTYSCSCPDMSIQNNMCKHVHLVCRFKIINEIHTPVAIADSTNRGHHSSQKVISTPENDIEIVQDLLVVDLPHNSETMAIVSSLSKDNDPNKMEMKKLGEELHTDLDKLISACDSKKQMLILKKILKSAKPRIEAERSKAIKFKPMRKVDTQKKIDPQRKFKKISKKKKKSVYKPTREETQKITLEAMLPKTQVPVCIEEENCNNIELDEDMQLLEVAIEVEV